MLRTSCVSTCMLGLPVVPFPSSAQGNERCQRHSQSRCAHDMLKVDQELEWKCIAVCKNHFGWGVSLLTRLLVPHFMHKCRKQEVKQRKCIIAHVSNKRDIICGKLICVGMRYQIFVSSNRERIYSRYSLLLFRYLHRPSAPPLIVWMRCPVLQTGTNISPQCCRHICLHRFSTPQPRAWC